MMPRMENEKKEKKKRQEEGRRGGRQSRTKKERAYRIPENVAQAKAASTRYKVDRWKSRMSPRSTTLSIMFPVKCGISTCYS